MSKMTRADTKRARLRFGGIAILKFFTRIARWRPVDHLAISIVLIVLATPWSATAAEPNVMPGATLDGLLALVQDANPELAAAALDSEEALAKIAPASALDDPMVSITNDQGFRQTIYTVSQEFSLWGKRTLRKEVATANADSVKSRALNVQAQLNERLRVAFAQYYESVQGIRIHHDIQSVLRTVAGTARSRYGQGAANQSDAIRAELERSRLDADLNALNQGMRTARARINVLIGRSPNAELADPVVLPQIPSSAVLNFDDLVVKARLNNPDIAMARADTRAAEGERSLVARSWYPDLTLTAGADDLPHQGPKPMIGVGIKIPLQWGARDAQADAARAKRSAAQYRLQAADLQVAGDIEASLAMLAQVQQTESLIETTLTPQSSAAYQSALASYQTGRSDLTPVLEAARQQREIAMERLRIETQAQTAFAAIQRLVGGDL
jgi:cobalt-zinc-cadmium efflux system outer membrane protein